MDVIQNPDYKANLELAKKWVQVFENGILNFKGDHV